MKKLITSVLGLLSVTASGLTLHAEEHAPRLVIGVHIDQLDENYLEWFSGGFSEEGFRKVMQSGTHVTDVVYPSSQPDNVAAVAAFMTGASPRQNGITGSSWYDRATGKHISCIADSRYLGNYTQDNVSPKNLQGSTLGDELRKASDNNAKVFSIGIDADNTVLLAGHAANAAFWLDNVSGKWCTSTWYNYMPWWLQNINDRENKSDEISKAEWNPLRPLENYRFMPHQKEAAFFRRKFNKEDKNRISLFKQSPLVNQDVVRIALEAIDKEQLGKDEITDYLILQLTADTRFDNEPLSPSEIQDLYFRLDEEVAKLLKAADKQVGAENVRLYLTGSGVPGRPAVNVPKEKAFTGDFYPDRCTSLLNLYLMAIYGNDQWVTAWDRQSIYLNRKRIEEKNISLDEITRKAADFLSEFSGIDRVYTLPQLLHSASTPELKAKAESIYPERAADLYVDIQGGWNIRERKNENDTQAGNAFFSIPFILYCPNQKAQHIGTPVSSGDITASLSKVFRIRPPTGCMGKALPELK